MSDEGSQESASFQHFGNALLALSGASLVRTARCGWGEGIRALTDSYRAIDPFSFTEKKRAQLERIPYRALSEIIDMPPEIELDLRWAGLDGSTPVNDLVAVLALAVAQKPEAALEFGTFWGSTTVNLAKNLPSATIHTIDLPPDYAGATALTEGQPVDDFHLIESRQLGKAFVGTPLAARIIQHLGDTARYDYSVIRDKVSFFMIDGSHTYEYAKSDTLRALALATGDFTIAWHDCDLKHPGVTQWLGEMMDAGLPVVRVKRTNSVAALKSRRDSAAVLRLLAANSK